MIIRILGTAAGGGAPQWNCACTVCQSLRRSGTPRLQDSLAVSADGQGWFLLNASPDITTQLEGFDRLHPGPSPRQTPLRGIFLTDAELDHCSGLLQLRQANTLDVYASLSILDALATALPLRQVLESSTELHWHSVRPGIELELSGGICVRPVALHGRPPRYVARAPSNAASSDDWTLAYRLTDVLAYRSDAALAYAPVVGAWSDTLTEALTGADSVLLDGTFWCEEELRTAGVGHRMATELGHLPIAGPDGSAGRFADLTARQKLYTHINNTNPILEHDSDPGRWLAAAGIGVARDGMEWQVPS